MTPRGHRSLAGVPGSPGVHPEGTPGDTGGHHRVSPPSGSKNKVFQFPRRPGDTGDTGDTAKNNKPHGAPDRTHGGGSTTGGHRAEGGKIGSNQIDERGIPSRQGARRRRARGKVGPRGTIFSRLGAEARHAAAPPPGEAVKRRATLSLSSFVAANGTVAPVRLSSRPGAPICGWRRFQPVCVARSGSRI